MGANGKPFDHYAYIYNHINDNLLALSGLGRLYHGLSFDAENLDVDQLQYADTVKKFSEGYFSFSIGRAIEILADDALSELERLEKRETRNESRPPTMGAA